MKFAGEIKGRREKKNLLGCETGRQQYSSEASRSKELRSPEMEILQEGRVLETP